MTDLIPPDTFPRAVEQAEDATIQARVSAMSSGIWLVQWMAQAGYNVPPWWSVHRDTSLREFWKKSDHLSGAIYTMTSKMTAIPNKVIARDQSVRKYVKAAEEATIRLRAAEFGESWVVFYSKWVEDLLTQDNGAFAEIIGPGDPDGPIIGAPVGLAHLDSWRCQRTGNSTYPIIYTDTDGKRYKLHRSRVMYASQMPSPIAEMYGVGFSAVSRCLNVSQTLMDILIFKQEKLGSRPHRQILITHGGLDPTDIQSAFQIAEGHMDSEGLSRYSKVVVGGDRSIPEAGIEMIELSSMPDGFNEETSITLGMATIALAFGVDARELFPAMGSGASRADALLQHLKQRGKGPGQILEITENLINYKFLPPYLRFEFDFQDDAQDRQVAEIKRIRIEGHRQAIMTGTVSTRVIREQMLNDGDLDRSQFERLELEDGRLADGTSVLALFYSEDPLLKDYLDLGVADPLDIEMQDPETIQRLIREKQAEVNRVLVNAKNEIDRWPAYKAFMALVKLEQVYITGDLSPFSSMASSNQAPYANMPGAVRTIDLTSPNSENDTNTGVSRDGKITSNSSDSEGQE